MCIRDRFLLDPASDSVGKIRKTDTEQTRFAGKELVAVSYTHLLRELPAHIVRAYHCQYNQLDEKEIHFLVMGESVQRIYKPVSYTHLDVYKRQEYAVGWLPLGGYVKIAGMIDESMDTFPLKIS